jgi:ubiquinone/menaquinone biosynthesis C-methylase UbiE
MPLVKKETVAQPDRVESRDWWNAMWKEHRPRFAQTLDEVRSQWDLYEIVKYDYLTTLFPSAPGTRSLECGCGSANASLYFALRGYDAVMLDYAESALDLARRNFNDAGARGTFVRGDVSRLEFPDASFDVVMSFGVIEHFHDVRPVIQEMMRVLRPGGLLFIDIVPKRFNVQTLANLTFNWWAAIGHGLLTGKPLAGLRKARELFRPPFYENSFTRAEYAAWMREAGCEDVVITGNNPFPRLYLPGPVDRLFIGALKWALPWWKRFDRSPNEGMKKHWARAWWAHGFKKASS